MRSLKNLGRIVIAGACMFAIVVLSGDIASARPKYAAVMSTAYPDLTKKHGKNNKLSCAVCHPSKSKKKRNNYGVEVGKGLTKKNESDEEKIKEALTKAEAGKSHVEGKTFGDLIKAGELPGDDKEAN
ncbi:MAG: hypothetical protein RIK87_16620 [Fuerstiella sp.]